MKNGERVPESWSGLPLRPGQPDSLGRGDLVKSVVARIDSTHIGASGTVFGLVGPWGSGKTSLLNRIRSSLPDDWRVASFSPWSGVRTKWGQLMRARVKCLVARADASIKPRNSSL